MGTVITQFLPSFTCTDVMLLGYITTITKHEEFCTVKDLLNMKKKKKKKSSPLI